MTSQDKMYQSIFRKVPNLKLFCYNWPSSFETAFLDDNAFNF